MHEWQCVHCFILVLCHYQDFLFKLMSCQLYYTSRYLQPWYQVVFLLVLPSYALDSEGDKQVHKQTFYILAVIVILIVPGSSIIDFWFEWAILTRMVPPVWYLNGRSTFLCTMKFGRRATGGTSVIWATLILHYKETAENTQNKGGMEERLIFKQAQYISFKLSLRLSPKHTFYLSLLNNLHAAIIYFQ